MNATNLFHELFRLAEAGHREIQAKAETAAREQQAAARQAELRAIAAELRKTMGCNCDLDNWEPERSTGHSWACRIHKAAIAKATSSPRTPAEREQAAAE